MRFDSARAAGLTEDRLDLVEDGYETRLDAAEAAALKLADALIGGPASGLSAEHRAVLDAHFSDAEIAELALGAGVFLGMSKVLINFGLEPEDMPVSLVPTPGG